MKIIAMISKALFSLIEIGCIFDLQEDKEHEFNIESGKQYKIGDKVIIMDYSKNIRLIEITELRENEYWYKGRIIWE